MTRVGTVTFWGFYAAAFVVTGMFVGAIVGAFSRRAQRS